MTADRGGPGPGRGRLQALIATLTASGMRYTAGAVPGFPLNV